MLKLRNSHVSEEYLDLDEYPDEYLDEYLPGFASAGIAEAAISNAASASFMEFV